MEGSNGAKSIDRVMAIMEGRFASESQPQSAKRMYDARSADYEDSWHPAFARDFISRVPLAPGAKVLDLACGTGLITFLAAEAVGPTGSVVGIDISSGMLAIARQKLQDGAPPTRPSTSSSADLLQLDDDEPAPAADPSRWKNVRLFEHSITELDSLEELAKEKGTFDAITVASALVLLEYPDEAIRSWLAYLKPGGVLALDVPHPTNLISGIILERIGRRMGVPVPFHRGWVRNESSLPDLLRNVGGMKILENTFVAQQGWGERILPVELGEVDRQFNIVISSEAGKAFGQNRGPKWQEARMLFREEWLLEAEASDETGVKEVDGVWVVVAKKAPIEGSCRCGAVTYAAAEQPFRCSICHCRTCQKLSGGDHMVGVCFKVADITWLDDSEQSLKKFSLSKNAIRGFCTGCGTPVYMRYRENEGGALTQDIWLYLGMINQGLQEGFKVDQHIFLDEKSPWEVLPDDGAQRLKLWDENEIWTGN